MKAELTFDGEVSFEDRRTEPVGIMPGSIVIVRGGKFHGCILTYLGRDRLGDHVCQHSDYCGGLTVPNVESHNLTRPTTGLNDR